MDSSAVLDAPEADATIAGAANPSSVDLFSALARSADMIQRQIVELVHEPDLSKRLRLFSTTEAAGWIGIGENRLRGLLRTAGYPDGRTLGNSPRRALSFQDMVTVRTKLYQETGDARFATGRRPGEPPAVLAVANFKGGVAKTTTTVHLAQYLVLKGYRVLLIDLDSQASATTTFGFTPDDDFGPLDTLYAFFAPDQINHATSLANLVRPTYWPGLAIIPANLALYRSEIDVPVAVRQDHGFAFWTVLRDALPSLDDAFDVVLIDTPPALGYLTINGIIAADILVIPVSPQMLDFSSTGRFLRMMADTLDTLAHVDGAPKRFEAVRILVTRYVKGDDNQEQLIRQMAALFGPLLCEHRMVTTTALDASGNTKRSLYECSQAEIGRSTFQRAAEALAAVNAELLRTIERTVWKRGTGVDG